MRELNKMLLTGPFLHNVHDVFKAMTSNGLGGWISDYSQEK